MGKSAAEAVFPRPRGYEVEKRELAAETLSRQLVTSGRWDAGLRGPALVWIKVGIECAHHEAGGVFVCVFFHVPDF
jgi:hypothetical protein